MRMLAGFALFAASLLPLSDFSQNAWAAEPGATSGDTAAESGAPRVARLIRDLGADEFSARQLADERLARLGPEIRRDLDEALQSDDAEVRLRRAVGRSFEDCRAVVSLAGAL